MSVVAFGENVPPMAPSLQVPPVAVSPTLPPKAAVVPPLQMAANAAPAFAVTQRRRAMVIPALIRGVVFTLQFNPPNPVAPAVVFVPQAAPTTGVLATAL